MLDISDPTRLLVLRAALANYGEDQYREARKYRALQGYNGDYRARMAGGCDARRREAEAMLAELDTPAKPTALMEKLATALQGLHHQCDYLGAPASHDDMQAATEALAEYVAAHPKEPTA